MTLNTTPADIPAAIRSKATIINVATAARVLQHLRSLKTWMLILKNINCLLTIKE